MSQDLFDRLVADYPSWWIDFLGEHNHVGGAEATRWLAERSGIAVGDAVLDTGAFVGASARHLAQTVGARPIATDLNPEFLEVGRGMPGGDAVEWIVADTSRLPFSDAAFTSVWCLDSYLAPRELTRVVRSGGTLCLCTEAPADSRGGLDAFLDEWFAVGWTLSAHKPMSLDATQQWRAAESAMVARRRYYEERYGTRGYLGQLDLLSSLVRSYERGEQGHALFVFRKPDA